MLELRTLWIMSSFILCWTKLLVTVVLLLGDNIPSFSGLFLLINWGIQALLLEKTIIKVLFQATTTSSMTKWEESDSQMNWLSSIKNIIFNHNHTGTIIFLTSNHSILTITMKSGTITKKVILLLLLCQVQMCLFHHSSWIFTRTMILNGIGIESGISIVLSKGSKLAISLNLNIKFHSRVVRFLLQQKFNLKQVVPKEDRVFNHNLLKQIGRL